MRIKGTKKGEEDNLGFALRFALLDAKCQRVKASQGEQQRVSPA